MNFFSVYVIDNEKFMEISFSKINGSSDKIKSVFKFVGIFFKFIIDIKL